MIVKAKNLDTQNQSYPGWVLTPGQEITLTEDDIIKWRSSCKVMDDITNNILQIGDDTQYFTAHGTQIAHLSKVEVLKVESKNETFSSKTTPDGKKIFRRKHGFEIAIDANSNTELILTVPYASVKINEVELCNCTAGDAVDFKVFDTVDGLYQQLLGVPAGSVNPDLMLNQFGFGVRMPDGMYRDISTYDADLIGTMRIKVCYTNNTANAVTIYGNIIYHEVV